LANSADRCRRGGSRLKLATLVVSHGVSVHAFSSNVFDRIRALGWIFYRLFRLPRLISRASALTTLSPNSSSLRFFDARLGSRQNIPVTPLYNAPIHWSSTRKTNIQRKKQILMVGYFSPIKNQLAAIELMDFIPDSIDLCFIGQRSGKYFERCKKLVKDSNLGNRIFFLEDHECDIAEEISSSILVLSCSITEALPICLLEAMASGTPFVATAVGAVPALQGGIASQDSLARRDAIIELISDPERWGELSQRGIGQFESEFSESKIAEQLAASVDLAVSNHINQARNFRC